MNKQDGGYWLAIDQGTTSTRAVLYDSVGQTVATAKRQVALRRGPADGHVEQDASEIAASVDDTINEVIQPIDPKQIRGTALATQRSSVVAWDRENGQPLSRVLSWQDTRCRNTIDDMQSHAEEIQRRTGLPLSAHYGASKISWLLQAEHSDRAAIVNARQQERLTIGPLACFLIQHLVDHEATKPSQRSAQVDHANAGRTQLMDVATGEWDPWLLKRFDVPSDILPNPLPTESDYGPLRMAPTRLLVVQGDQTAAVFGQGGLDEDLAHINLGTGGFVLSKTPNINPYTRLLQSVASSRRSASGRAAMEYVLEGTINGCGAAIDWAAERLGLIVTAENIEQWLQASQPMVFVNTVGGLGSPFWCEGLPPHWTDLKGEPTQPQDKDAAMLAVLESILFLVVANLRAMQTHRGTESAIRHLRVTGGLSQSDTLCQRLANATQLTVRRPAIVEATARGAAWLAAGRPASWNETNRSPDQWRPQEDLNPANRCDRFLKQLEATPTRAPSP